MQVFPHKPYLKKAALVLVALCALFMVLSLYKSSILSYIPTQLQQDDSSNEFVETKGRQPIKDGCVNLYGSDWAMYPNTRAVVICNEMTSGFMEAQIDNIGFSKDSENHGISYVETGSGATVTLYTQNDYGGNSLVIDPDSKVWLQQVLVNGGNGARWNDNVMSVYFQGHSGPVVAVQTSGITESNMPPCADHCIQLFGSDPSLKIGKGGTSVTVLCSDPLKARVWKFSYSDITTMNDGVTLKSLSLGVSFVAIGSQLQLEMFSGPNFDGQSYVLKKPTKNKSIEYIDLTKVPYPVNVCALCSGWNDKPMSFILTVLGDITP